MFYTSEPVIKYVAEPISKPYQGPYTIPVMLDDMKQLEDFHMSRCTFFSIEPVGSFDNWVGYLRAQDVPFLVLGVTSVLHRPNLTDELFTTKDAIDKLFEQIEAFEGLVVESEHIWFPNFLLLPFVDANEKEEKPPLLERGAIWRIDYGLFQLALTFQRQVFGTTAYQKICQQLVDRGVDLLKPSVEETKAFQAWSRNQIEAAKKHYEEQRADLNRGVLEYIDDQGVKMAG